VFAEIRSRWAPYNNTVARSHLDHIDGAYQVLHHDGTANAGLCDARALNNMGRPGRRSLAMRCPKCGWTGNTSRPPNRVTEGPRIKRLDGIIGHPKETIKLVGGRWGGRRCPLAASRWDAAEGPESTNTSARRFACTGPNDWVSAALPRTEGGYGEPGGLLAHSAPYAC
jgi:hypothetical protein